MAENPPEKPPSLRQRGARAARLVTDPVASAAGALTGKSVEEEVSEYSETFTQVALGLHEDVSAVTRRLSELEAAVAEHAAASTSHVTARRSMLQVGLATAALVTSAVALAIVLWAT